MEEIILILKSKCVKKISDIIDFIFRLYKEFDILDYEYKIDDVVKNYKEYNSEKKIIDEYDFEKEIKDVYDNYKSEIKSNIRKIVKTVLSDWKEYFKLIYWTLAYFFK